MPPEPTDMVPPTLELARGRIVGFAVLAIAGSVVFGVALNDAFHHPSKKLHTHRALFPKIDPTRADITLARLHRLAFEGFPSWKQAHPLDACPRAIEDLADYTNTETRGPYGGSAKFIYTCDPAVMPPGVHGIWIRDLGEDEKLGTADDFTSDMIGDDE
jgi:hypothetical protein